MIIHLFLIGVAPLLSLLLLSLIFQVLGWIAAAYCNNERCSPYHVAGAIWFLGSIGAASGLPS